MRAVVVLAAVLLASSSGLPMRLAPDHACQRGAPVADPPSELATRILATGLGEGLTDLAFAPNQSQRALWTARTGQIGWVDLADGTSGNLTDLSGTIGKIRWDTALNSLAFDPRFPAVPWLWLTWLDDQGQTALAHVDVATTWPHRPDPATVTTWASLAAPDRVHAFGGVRTLGDRLLVGVGDLEFYTEEGAMAARDPMALRGKLLRIDPAAPAPGALPAHLPLDGIEVAAWGLRNPWRFDVQEGWLALADVGRDRWEEIDLARADCLPLDFGWGALEGSRLRPGWSLPEGTVAPVADYAHGPGCAVIGASLHHGSIPGLAGAVVTSDFCDWRLRVTWWDGAAWQTRLDPNVAVWTQSINTGPDGETYILGVDGTIHRLDVA